MKLFFLATLLLQGIISSAQRRSSTVEACPPEGCSARTASLLQRHGMTIATKSFDTTSNGLEEGDMSRAKARAVARKTTRRVAEMMLVRKGIEKGSFEDEKTFGKRKISLSIEAEGAEFSHRSGSKFPVNVTVKNNGASSYVMMKLESPFEDEIVENMFVTKPSTSEFTGPILERWGAGPTADNSMLLHAGESFSKTLNLKKYLRFKEAGKYTLSLEYVFMFFELNTARPSFAEALGELGDETEESAIQTDIRSNDIEVNVVDAAEPSLQETQTSKSGRELLSFRSCDSSQQQIVRAANEIAKEMTDAARHYLDTQKEEDDWSEWFGTITPVFQDSVTTGIAEIDKVLTTQGYIVDCSCPAVPNGGAGVYAYVYPTDTSRTVYLCKVFWNAPTGKARDSQPGTIIHEISHFGLVYGTNDHAYGTYALRQLAQSEPNKARNNADSVEGYTEDGDLSLFPCGSSGCYDNGGGAGTGGGQGPTAGPVTCVTVTMTHDDYASENSWVLKNSHGECKSPDYHDDADSGEARTKQCCLPAGTYEVTCSDSYGDGWGSGTLQIATQVVCENLQLDEIKTTYDITSGGGSGTVGPVDPSTTQPPAPTQPPTTATTSQIPSTTVPSTPSTTFEVPSTTVPSTTGVVGNGSLTCVSLTMTNKAYAQENSWSLGSCSASYTSSDSDHVSTQSCCLPAGDYNLSCSDSYGDGWHGGKLEIDGQTVCELGGGYNEQKNLHG